MNSDNVIGVSVTASSASEGLERIERLDEMGVGAAWVTSGGGGGEAIHAGESAGVGRSAQSSK